MNSEELSFPDFQRLLLAGMATADQITIDEARNQLHAQGVDCTLEELESALKGFLVNPGHLEISLQKQPGGTITVGFKALSSAPTFSTHR